MAAIDMDRIKVHAQRFADGFTPGQKSITILGVVAVVIATFYFNSWAGTTEYAALYTGMEAEDASEVTAELDARGVSYKLEDGGRTVMVPRADVYQVRVDLSAEGLPSGGGDSYMLLDEGGITKSEFSQRVDYQRAVQGELARTIESIDGVATARVMLTIPTDSVFVGAEAERATASVLVEPTSGELNGESVQAIVHIVSSGVADMTPDDVTVADSLGNVLAAPGRGGSAMAGENFEQQQAFEVDLAQSVQNFVAAALGPGHAKVTVSADLDFSETSTVSRDYPAPAGGAEAPALRENTTSESFTGSPGGATGVLGPDGTPVDTGETPTEYTKEELERENAINEIVATTEDAPGQIERLSVSVLLDSEVIDAGDVTDWENAISAAAGIDATRTDTLNVELMPFDTEALEEAQAQLESAAGDQSKDTLLNMVRAVVTLLIVGIVLFLAWRAIKRSEANRVPLRVPLDLRELEAADLVPRDTSDIRRLPEATAVPARAPIEAQNLPVEDEVAGIIEQQPDEVALTLRSWLADRRG